MRPTRSLILARGVTLVETLLASTILSLILFGVYLVYDTGSQAERRNTSDAALLDSTRRSVEELAQQVRMAGFDPTGSGQFGFRDVAGFAAVARDDRVLFSLDADRDGVLDNNTAERVGFLLVGSELWRTTDGANAVAGLPPIARDVQSLQFAYFTASDAPIPNPANAPYVLDAVQRGTIRRITITLTFRRSAGSVGDREFTVSTDIRPRNL